MKIREQLGISEARQEQVSRLMQLSLVLIAGYGLYQGSTGIIVNAAVGLIVTFLPGILERDYQVSMDPGLVLWITSAVFLHALGTLGPYSYFSWWDHMTHALSASVVAAAGYTALRAVDEYSEQLEFPPKLFFVFILVFVLAFGVIWELLEFGLGGLSSLTGGNILTQHGLDDTMKDLVFDTLGGIVIAVFGEAYLLGVANQLVEKASERTSRSRLSGR